MPAPWVNDVNKWVEDTFHVIDPNKAQQQADGYQQDALNQILGLKTPDLQTVTPEQLGPSAMQGVQADPAARAAQSQALAQLMQAGSGGYGIEDRAALNNAMAEANQNAAGRSGAIAQQMQARGMGNSGFALAAQLANNQNAAQNVSSAGMNAAASSRARALQALQAGGSLASNIRGQSFSEGAQKASAQDDINARNAALRSQASYYNAGLPQQNFANQTSLAGMKAGAYQGAYNAAIDRRNRGEQQQQNFQNSLNNIQNGVGMAFTGMPMRGGGPSNVANYSSAPTQLNEGDDFNAWQRRGGGY